jgi:leucyl-tRNA synthetase
VWNDEFLVEDHITYPICINGKRRGEITVAADAVQEDIEMQVRNMEAVQKWLEGQIVKKVIIVPGRMVNLVI